MRNAYYKDSLEGFLNTNRDEIIGKLNLGGTEFSSQWTISTVSWASFLSILNQSFQKLIQSFPDAKGWYLLLEYEIPRLGKRIDAVLIADDLIFVIEFKYDRKKFEIADIRQVEDYALDLSDFHLESRDRLLIPVLLAPLAKSVTQILNTAINSNVLPTIKSNEDSLAEILLIAHRQLHNLNVERIDPVRWENSDYQPTPTIVQAAQALFSGQKVDNITKYGASNLSKTSKTLIAIINEAERESKKVVCFVTGVPGAGKTLVGLNIVHAKEEFGGSEFNTAYFSGNTPLINVLREALSRDKYFREMALFLDEQLQCRPKKADIDRELIAKIQNLHLFIKSSIRKTTPPTEKVVVFDEAQRCWDAKQFSNKAKQNQNREKDPFVIEEKSEAELLFEFMDRHDDWAVVIALVGSGQEINTGEGGIGEWGKALKEKYDNWEIHISSELLSGGSSTSGQKLFQEIPSNLRIHCHEELHLSVSQRSFKAANLNNWVNAVIDNKASIANDISNEIKDVYPLYITRDIISAKRWLRGKQIGTKRVGLVASSGALRLKPYSVYVREVIDETLWFLNDETDVRSSSFLEIAATEYKIQGLELDWVGVCWDADLRRDNQNWVYRYFSGSKWQQVNNLAEQQYLSNTYRVLLTRAREGIVVFVPKGESTDSTRLPEFYDPIFEYLISCGMKEI